MNTDFVWFVGDETKVEGYFKTDPRKCVHLIKGRRYSSDYKAGGPSLFKVCFYVEVPKGLLIR